LLPEGETSPRRARVRRQVCAVRHRVIVNALDALHIDRAALARIPLLRTGRSAGYTEAAKYAAELAQQGIAAREFAAEAARWREVKEDNS
jgi:hypothetical protein